MRTRMEKYYKDENTLQRTSKNDSLYEQLYKEHQEPTSNVTVLDNINEIDITKIKELVDNRENYKKVREYEKIIQKDNNVQEKEEYLFEEIDDSNYDINQILEKKKNDSLSEEDLQKIRKITNTQIDILADLKYDEAYIDDPKYKTLIDKIAESNDGGTADLFANLKETDEEKEEVIEEKEPTFYTKSNSFDQKDFNENIIEEEKSSNAWLIIITVFMVLVAVGIFVWFKFLK